MHIAYSAHLDARFGPVGSPDVIKTSLGWVLFGSSLVRFNAKQDTDNFA